MKYPFYLILLLLLLIESYPTPVLAQKGVALYV